MRIWDYFEKYDLGFEAHFKTAEELDKMLKKIRGKEYGISDFEIEIFAKS